MTFSENLKRICADRGLTPTSLLSELGVSTSKVTMWNNGSLPKYDMMQRLAERLNCSVQDFFADDSALIEPEPALTEDEQDILRVFRHLDRRSKHEFMSTVYDYERRTLTAGESEL